MPLIFLAFLVLFLFLEYEHRHYQKAYVGMFRLALQKHITHHVVDRSLKAVWLSARRFFILTVLVKLPKWYLVNCFVRV